MPDIPDIGPAKYREAVGMSQKSIGETTKYQQIIWELNFSHRYSNLGQNANWLCTMVEMANRSLTMRFLHLAMN